MAWASEKLELIGDWSVERDGNEVSIESVLLPSGEHQAVTEQFPQIHYERRNPVRIVLGRLAVDRRDRTRYIAVQDVTQQGLGDIHDYGGNAMLSDAGDVYAQPTHHRLVRHTRAVVGFRTSATRSIPSSIIHGDDHAVLTDLAVTNEGDPFVQQQYAAIAVLSAFRYLASRRTPTTVAAGRRLEQDRSRLWESLHPESAGLPLQKGALRHPISNDAADAYDGFRQYLIRAKMLGG